MGPARAWCSGRAHGNVGDHVGDDPAVVAAHRFALGALTGGTDPHDWVWVRQVHGTAVHVATARDHGDASEAPPVEADAIVTTAPGLPLAIVTADCAPLVVACEGAVGVVHAGHRGLAAGVIEAMIGRVRALGAGDVHAFLGPCIHVERYEFGADDLARLLAQFGPGVEGRTITGRPALDIPAAVRIVLERAGVGSFVDSAICTATSDAYFSYRRDGETGRQVTVAMLP